MSSSIGWCRCCVDIGFSS